MPNTAHKSSFIQRMTKVRLLSMERKLELYPLFLFMGVKIDPISDDGRRMHVHLPLRWYARNLHGTMFGGYLCAVSDPLPALLCGRIFPGVEVWTKTHCVDFLKPAHGAVDIELTIHDADVEKISAELKRAGKAVHSFEFPFYDKGRKEIARARNTVYFRLRQKAHGQQ